MKKNSFGSTNFLKKFIVSFLITGLSFLKISGQQVSVTLKVTNSKQEPLPNTTIKITAPPDSLFSRQAITDSSGLAVFSLSENSPYFVFISSVNHLNAEKVISLINNQVYFAFELEPISKNLDTLILNSKSPLFTQEDDKTIVNPENLVASSTNGFEVIEKVPGIFMDQDGNIYLNSLSPATVYINGRELKMSAADIASMLKSLPPTSILKIEILKTPSAKYDASGAGGMVNVILKKGVKIGLTGSITTGLQQGTYGNQFIGFSLNNNDGKKSYFLNANYGRRNSYEKITTNRLFAADTILNQDAYTRYPGNSFHSNYGLSWSTGEKWDLDYDGSISGNDSKNNSENNSVIKKISSGSILTNNLNEVSNKSGSLNIRNGFSSKYKIDSIGSEWVNDISFSNSRNNSNQSFTTFFYSPQLPDINGDGKVESQRNLFAFRSDLKLKIKKITVETGLKTSVLYFKNETNYFRETNGARAKDTRRTNTFRYNENINSAYFQASKTFGNNFTLKAGTRIENTNMNGKQSVPTDTSFKLVRTDLFPYVFLSRSIMKIAGYQLKAYLVYRRSIQRPVYEQLNPFERYIDQYLSEVGNPSLKPQFTNNYEFNISFEERPVFALGVKDTKDIFSNVIYQSDTSLSQAFRTYDNLGKNKEWYFRGLGALPPGGKYFFVMGAQYNFNFYDGFYESKPLSYKRGSWMLFTYHTLKLDKKSQISMNGFVRFKGLLQFTEVNTFGALNANLNRRFLKDKLVITLSANDIFFSNQYHFSIQQGSVNAYGLRQNDTRRYGLNIRYNFGIHKRDDKKNMFDVESPEKQ